MMIPFYCLLLLIPCITDACPYAKTRRLQGGGGGGGGGGMGHGGMYGGGGMGGDMPGMGNDPGMGNGGNMPGRLIMQLLNNHGEFHREVSHNEDGTIRTRTLSSDNGLARTLQRHVKQMQERAEAGHYIRAWDPFFVELIERHDEYTMDVTNVDDGVEVVLSGKTDCGQALIESHASIVTLFVKKGYEEAGNSHDAPSACLKNDWTLVAEAGEEVGETEEIDIENGSTVVEAGEDTDEDLGESEETGSTMVEAGGDEGEIDNLVVEDEKPDPDGTSPVVSNGTTSSPVDKNNTLLQDDDNEEDGMENRSEAMSRQDSISTSWPAHSLPFAFWPVQFVAAWFAMI